LNQRSNTVSTTTRAQVSIWVICPKSRLRVALFALLLSPTIIYGDIVDDSLWSREMHCNIKQVSTVDEARQITYVFLTRSSVTRLAAHCRCIGLEIRR
jgi:hypothetical protein